jgi:hypothetical protein
MSRKNPIGRPSIGQPEMVWGRVSVEVRQQINDLSDDLGIPRSRVVAALLETALADLTKVQFPRRSGGDQQELPLTKAS